LYRLVLSQTCPQKNDAGIARNNAAPDIIPISTNEPPIAITYNGRKMDSIPKPISWKKKPKRHIATDHFKTELKPLPLWKLILFEKETFSWYC
jgi:hypothetical protein